MRRLVFLLAVGLFAFNLVVIPFAQEYESRLFALDAKTGQIRWTAELPDGRSTVGSIAVAANHLFMQTTTKATPNSYRWQLEMFDMASGQKQWTFRPEAATYQFWNFSVPLFATANTVYASIDANPDRPNQLLAIDVATGKLRWAIDRTWPNDEFDRQWGVSFGSTNLGVVEQGNRVVMTLPSENEKTLLQAVNQQTGKLVWRVKFDELSFDPPSSFFPSQWLAANDRTVFFLDKTGTIHAYALTTGKPLFTVASTLPTGEASYSPSGKLAIAGTTLYQISSRLLQAESDLSSSAIQAFDSATGKQRWIRSSTGNQCKQEFSYSELQVNAEYLAVICSDRTGSLLSIIDPKDGHRRWSKKIESYPAFNSQSIFTRSKSTVAATSQVLALSAQDGAEQWRFPQKSMSGTSPSDPVTQGDWVFVRRSTSRWQNLLLRLHLAD